MRAFLEGSAPRTDLNDVCAQAAELREPIVFTKNGTPAVVLMDAEAFEADRQRERISRAVREAEIEEKYRPETCLLEQAESRLEQIFAALEHGRREWWPYVHARHDLDDFSLVNPP